MNILQKAASFVSHDNPCSSQAHCNQVVEISCQLPRPGFLWANKVQCKNPDLMNSVSSFNPANIFSAAMVVRVSYPQQLFTAFAKLKRVKCPACFCLPRYGMFVYHICLMSSLLPLGGSVLIQRKLLYNTSISRCSVKSSPSEVTQNIGSMMDSIIREKTTKLHH